MFLEIHIIQNHSPANLNRDDLGAPKTCYFGGVLRSRISSQCLKRSIRMSNEFSVLLGGIRTRQLAKLIAEKAATANAEKRAEKILELCGFKTKDKKATASASDNNEEEGQSQRSKMLIYTTKEAVSKMANLLKIDSSKKDEDIVVAFAEIITNSVYVPDMALCGRMLEPSSKIWEKLNTTVEASLQAAHAISTHAARPEVDYYVAADDVPGDNAGAGYVDEAMFASACFYKYFSIDWEQLVKNLNGNKELAAHTIGAFLRAAALVAPTGKQNSFAAHNMPDGILVEATNRPVSYANAFVKPAVQGERDLPGQSIAKLGQYGHSMDVGYGKHDESKRFWFSPDLIYPLRYIVKENEKDKEYDLTSNNLRSLDELVSASVKAISGLDWQEVQKAVVNQE